MARITEDLIVSQAAAAGRQPPSEERAEALAKAVALMIQAAEKAAAKLNFEAEPAHFLSAMDETAAD